jgi:ABC-type transporter Mla subunit MlaD
MKENKINATIAIITVVAAVLMALSLSLAIGKWSFGSSGYNIVLLFPSATGIDVNSEVKYAGARAGRVKEVRLIPRKEQTQDPLTKTYNCVEIVVNIEKDIEIGKDVTATLKQDGLGISAKYVLLMPGPDHDAPPLANNDVVQGTQGFDLTDLVQPAGEALTEARNMLGSLRPVLGRLDKLSAVMETSLPPLLDNGNKFLTDGDSVLANLNTPESRERINEMLANLRVSTDNLKVVSSNAKALTQTLAQTPWRVFWGGPTVPAPPENEVLKSNKVIRLTPNVDVNGADTSTAKKKPIAQP